MTDRAREYCALYDALTYWRALLAARFGYRTVDSNFTRLAHAAVLEGFLAAKGIGSCGSL